MWFLRNNLKGCVCLMGHKRRKTKGPLQSKNIDQQPILQESSLSSPLFKEDRNRTISIKFKYVAIAAYLYITIPILIFLMTWLRLYIGLPMAMLLASGLICLIRSDYIKCDKVLHLPRNVFLGALFCLLLWVIYSGNGGFFYQTPDNISRNAIFRDLIDYDWPIVYPKTGNALVYYLMFWIVPSLFGKMFGWIGGNIALMLWSFIGIALTFLMIVYITKSCKKWHIALASFLLITWSGMNLVGNVVSTLLNICAYPLSMGSFEGWLDFIRNGYDCSYLYRSNIDALCQVYNQTIIPWLAVTLIIENKNIKNFAFIGLCVLPYAPMPLVGMLPLFLVYAIPVGIQKLKDRQYIGLLKETFSFINFSAIFSIFIVMFFFFKTNVSLNSNETYISLFVPWEAFDWARIVTLLLFYLFEFGIVCILIYPKYKCYPVYWTSIITLILIPFFKIGGIRDFCMNASLPFIFILMILTIQYLVEKYQSQMPFKYALNFVTLLLILAISTTTIIGDAAVKVKIIRDTNTFPIRADSIVTYSDKNIGDIEWAENYLVPEPNQTFFFKYFAKQ